MMNVPVKNQMLYNKRTPFGDHFRVSFCPLVDIFFISFSYNIRVLSQAKKKILTLKIFDKIAAILSKKRSRRCALSRAKRTSATQKVHFY